VIEIEKSSAERQKFSKRYNWSQNLKFSPLLQKINKLWFICSNVFKKSWERSTSPKSFVGQSLEKQNFWGVKF